MVKDGRIVVGILEDIKEEGMVIENALYDIAHKHNIDLEVQFVANTWQKFIDNLQTYSINTCILDIELKDSDITGMNVAHMIDSMRSDIKIIFLTGHRGYIIEAFKVSAFDYLMKPLKNDELERTILRLRDKLSLEGKKCLEIYTKEYIRIPYRDIVYIQYEGRRVKIVTVDSIEILPSTITFRMVVDKLPKDNFIECNSYTCVNMDYVRKVRGVEIELNIPELVNLSDGEFKITNKMYASQSGSKRIKEFIKTLMRM